MFVFARILILCTSVLVSACASTSVYERVAESIFPPEGTNLQTDSRYQAEYSRTDAAGAKESSRLRLGETYAELQGDISDCVRELEEQYERVRALSSGPSTPQASVQLIVCLRGRGWEVRVDPIFVVT